LKRRERVSLNGGTLSAYDWKVQLSRAKHLWVRRLTQRDV